MGLRPPTLRSWVPTNLLSPMGRDNAHFPATFQNEISSSQCNYLFGSWCCGQVRFVVPISVGETAVNPPITIPIPTWFGSTC